MWFSLSLTEQRLTSLILHSRLSPGSPKLTRCLPVSIILSLLQLHQTTVFGLSWVSHAVPGHYQQSSSFRWEGLFVLSSSSANPLPPFFSPVQPQVVNSMKKASLIAPLISFKARPSLFCSFTTLSTWHPPSPPHNAWTSIYRDVCLNKR